MKQTLSTQIQNIEMISMNHLFMLFSFDKDFTKFIRKNTIEKLESIDSMGDLSQMNENIDFVNTMLTLFRNSSNEEIMQLEHFFFKQT